jgi:uncharacterized protein (TIGR03067 family)
MSAASLLAVAASVRADDAKKDLDAMQGSWVLVSSDFNGQKTPEDQLKSIRRTIKDDKITITIGEMEIYQGTFKLDASKKPKAIDVTMNTGQNKGQVSLGIYEFDGETMKVCMAGPGGPRPTDYTAKEGTNQRVAVWKKEKK